MNDNGLWCIYFNSDLYDSAKNLVSEPSLPDKQLALC